jgi:hypothetical protein
MNNLSPTLRCCVFCLLFGYSNPSFAQNNQITPKKPLIVSIFNLGTQLPGSGYLGVFTVPVHPGISVGTEFRYNNGTILNVTNYNTGSGNGYGGVYSNVYDLQRFIEALVRDKTLLQPGSLSQMLTFTNPVDGVNRANGLGIFRDFLERAPHEYAYGHRGRDLGYTADMYWFPEQDITMTYFINYGTDAKSSIKPYFYEFRTALVDALMAP